MRYHVAGQSHRGVVRESNQDVVDWRINDAGDQALLVVADGMGGHQGVRSPAVWQLMPLSNPWNRPLLVPRSTAPMVPSGSIWSGPSRWPMSG